MHSLPPYDPPASADRFRERRIGQINGLGLWTLYVREVRRFLKVYLQTIIGPAVTTLLFLMIFTIALGRQGRMIGDVPYSDFLIPGLIAMAIIQNAFANTSSSILIGKVQGTIQDILMPPLSAGELVLGHVAGGVTRGLMVAATVATAVLVWPGMEHAFVHPLALGYFAVSAAVALSLAGMLTSIWADKFDHSAAVTNFVVQPLSLLSGTFYSVAALPDFWRTLSHWNPFFFLIDGLRYGMIGHSDGDVMTGAIATLLINIGLWLWCRWLLAIGYKTMA